ncbi:uncharacterized protein [Antennarius striatus]|uniref:uncharacterized protein isoform X2 n=1 Tax=Antennarius striatus TaxID=241820 RepID=UPI0035B08920
MLRFFIFCHAWFLHSALIGCSLNATGVIRFSVPEEHHVLLSCGGSDGSDVVWTHQDRRVPVTSEGGPDPDPDPDPDRDPHPHVLLPDGSLQLLQLDESDSGEYRCNRRLVAELQVLTGHDLAAAAGRTLLLPCRRSSKPRRRWFHRREGGKRELIFTSFRNGTATPERGGGRLSYQNDALQIENLQPDDAGQYQCNGELWTLAVTTLIPEPTGGRPATNTTATPAVMKTELVETKKKEKKKRPENGLLMVAVVGLGFMILLMAAVCVLLVSARCRRRKHGAADSRKRDDTELQPWRTSDGQTEREGHGGPPPPEEMIHYASLGRHTWRDGARRTPLDQNHHVIYSSVITRPDAQ